MERKSAADPISQSADIVSDNIEKLKQLFPSVFTEGNIDFEALKDILGDKVETDPEYYRFTWPGKAMAKAEARKPSRGTLRPAKDESVNWDTTENLYIEGDNLEVLKLLQKSYANKVKMIYIDPPYNTGKDFVYKDNYKDNLSNYNEKFNRTDDEGNLISSAAETNQEGSARYHSDWLNMMYPRLTLARNLLTDDGVIFMSIDDNEVKNLKCICDEIFGEECFITQVTWKSKYGAGAKTNGFIDVHEYILCYTKKPIISLDAPIGEEAKKSYSKKDDKFEIRGGYFTQPLMTTSMDDRPNLQYSIYHQGIEIKPRKQWVWGKERLLKAIEDDNIVFSKKNDGSYSVRSKQYLIDENGNERKGKPLSVMIGPYTQEGTSNIKGLFKDNVFGFTKPVSLLRYLLSFSINETDNNESIVLDFFSGSASSAEALFKLNQLNGGKRKFIQVQLPEVTDEKSEAYKAGYKTIPEIGKERIRRAGKKILEENPDQKDKLDIGFKVFKLDESNIKTWETDPEKLDANLFLEDVIKTDRTEEDVLYEILLKYGLDLTLPIQEKEIDAHKLYAIGGGALLVYLGDKAKPSIAQEIINWAKELGAINPQAVFKDSGFQNSQDKVNTLQLLKSNNITDVWSI